MDWTIDYVQTNLGSVFMGLEMTILKQQSSMKKEATQHVNNTVSISLSEAFEKENSGRYRHYRHAGRLTLIKPFRLLVKP